MPGTMLSLSFFLIRSALNLVSLGSPTNQSRASNGFSRQCTSVATKLHIPQANISFTEFVAANTTLQFPNADPSCTRPSQAVSANICRVGLSVKTSATSGIRMEVWLPQNWTGRFLSTGNGGLGGCIQYEDLDYAASLGFASVGTNNGHEGMTGESFLNNSGVIEDFAYRAVHTGVVFGKQVSETFYGKTHSKSYYLGCSTGGRQGFKAVQSFPNDFDGVVAGAPAFSFNNLTSWSSGFLPLTGSPESATFVPLDMWPIIHQDVLAQCDMLDGVADGILESPDLCHYDPAGLLCTSDRNTTCLTAAQVQTVRKSYAPLLSADGSLIYPRLQPGAEGTEAPFTLFTGRAFGASDWFKYAVLNDSSWDPSTLSLADMRLSAHLNLADIETWNGDLSAFKAAGGKLLHYHGLVDGVITSENSPRYYEHVSTTMQQAPAQLDDFYRFFRISGMAHCGGGPGASRIGNQARNSAGSLDPEDNVLMAMVSWVEEGVAPEVVVGTRYKNGTTAGSGVDYKRRHCKWPARNVYKGVGDYKDPLNWECI